MSLTAKILPTLFMLLIPGIASAADRTTDKTDDWGPYRFLIGEWVGEGQGTPGKGGGGFTLLPELDGKILLRKNTSDIPASGGRPAVHHEDLLIVYRAPNGLRNRAIYFDNEDHVIQYTVTPSDHGKSLSFLSDAAPNTPRFRLTYVETGNDTVKIQFDIAPPGKPDAFRTYLTGTVKRKSKSE
jgi:hypothetical protein